MQNLNRTNCISLSSTYTLHKTQTVKVIQRNRGEISDFLKKSVTLVKRHLVHLQSENWMLAQYPVVCLDTQAPKGTGVCHPRRPLAGERQQEWHALASVDGAHVVSNRRGNQLFLNILKTHVYMRYM